MLRLSNERTELCIKKAILEKEVRLLEDKLEYLKTTLRDGDVLASQLKLSVSNIYAQLCRRLSIAPTVTCYCSILGTILSSTIDLIYT